MSDHRRSEILGEIEDALAVALRRIMAQNGRPVRREYVDKELYEVHARQWADAEQILRAYDGRALATK